MRGGAEADDVRAVAHRAIVAIGSPMMQGDVDRHGDAWEAVSNQGADLRRNVIFRPQTEHDAMIPPPDPVNGRMVKKTPGSLRDRGNC